MILNAEAISALNRLEKEGILRRCAKEGFIDHGRGSLWIPFEQAEIIYFMPKFEWEKCTLDKGLIKVITNLIDTYQPSAQAVLVVSALIDEHLEIVISTVKFPET